MPNKTGIANIRISFSGLPSVIRLCIFFPLSIYEIQNIIAYLISAHKLFLSVAET